MKQTFFIVALFIGVLLFAGGYADSRHQTALGKTAPSLEMANADSVVALDRLRGDYVLVNFWSSTDAPSREAANLYTAWQRRHPEADLRLIGINFDESTALFHEIVKLDSLESADQFHAAGDTATAIINSYGLGDGLGSVLIDPEGKITAYNPTDADLDVIFDVP